MKPGICGFAVLFSILLASCSQGYKAPDSEASNAVTHFEESGQSPNPCITVTMGAPQEVQQGTGLTAILTATNTCEVEVDLQLGVNRPQDLYVVASDGTVLFQASYGEGVPAAGLDIFRMGPNESRRYEVQWDGRDNDNNLIPSGAYRLAGILYSVKVDQGDVYTPEGNNFEVVQPLSIN